MLNEMLHTNTQDEGTLRTPLCYCVHIRIPTRSQQETDTKVQPNTTRSRRPNMNPIPKPNTVKHTHRKYKKPTKRYEEQTKTNHNVHPTQKTGRTYKNQTKTYKHVHENINNSYRETQRNTSGKPQKHERKGT